MKKVRQAHKYLPKDKAHCPLAKYDAIVFDIDGTLMDSEAAIMNAAKVAVFEKEGIEVSTATFMKAYGLPTYEGLRVMGVKEENLQATAREWEHRLTEDQRRLEPFPQIIEMLERLRSEAFDLGTASSKDEDEYTSDFDPSPLSAFFTLCISASDVERGKPNPDQLLKYLALTGHEASRVLYVGDSPYDYLAARDAGCDFLRAAWTLRGVPSTQEAKEAQNRVWQRVASDYQGIVLESPLELFDQIFLDSARPKNLLEPWISWATELQALSAAGLAYTKDPYDYERFLRIREISAEILAYQQQIPLSQVKDLFCGGVAYHTPKMETRAAVFDKDGRMLFVREKQDGSWSMPGGWLDEAESVVSNALKEIREEADLKAQFKKLVAILRHDRRNPDFYPYGIIKVFVHCEASQDDINGLVASFHENTEISDIAFFSFDELKTINVSKGRNSLEQIKLCFDAKDMTDWNIVLD